jgi:hypothetical protein
MRSSGLVKRIGSTERTLNGSMMVRGWKAVTGPAWWRMEVWRILS